MSWRSLQALFGLAVCVAGCTHAPRENIPTYQWTDDQTALRTIAQRARSIHSVSAQALLTLTRPDGQSVRLQGAIVMKFPERVHLRAWKFNQPVFDLTLADNNLWIESRDRQRALPATLSAGQLARALSMFAPEFWESPDLRVIDSPGPRFQVHRPMPQKQVVTAEIERATLTARRYELRDPDGRVRFTLELAQYQSFGSVAWPTRLLARSDAGRIEVDLHDIEINQPIPAEAFVPPAGAEKAP